MKRARAPKTMLVIDDDRALAQTIGRCFQNGSIEVELAYSGTDGLKICMNRQVDVVVLDQKLPDGLGADFCPRILAENDQAKIIFITGYPSFSHAVEAIKMGAYDYLSKPFDMEQLQLAVQRAFETIELEQLKQVQTYKDVKDHQETVLIGSREGLAEVYRMAELAADSSAPVLISGETGAGKGLVAKSIHYLGAARKSSFITVNCGALPEYLIEAELFGYEKGAFTGAVTARKGLFEMAEGGTLFLDEICTLPLHVQSKLLGVLDDREIRRIGGRSVRSVNTRIITATNDDVESEVRNKLFREDLYYRLSVIRIHVPPLREHKEDIPELSRFFVRQLSSHQRLTVPESEIERLMAYDWPGNVRELKNVIERSIILRENNLLYPSHFLGKLHQAPFGSSDRIHNPHGFGDQAPFQVDDVLSLQEMEKEYIQHILTMTSGNRTQAAQTLGIARSTLIRKIRDYGLLNTVLI